MSVKRVLIVRHGQTDYNSARRWQGHLDIPLNEKGLTQAQALADYLRSTAIHQIYSSDLQRAMVTAQILAEGRNIPIVLETRLREFNLGYFEGLTSEEIGERYENALSSWRSSDDYVVPDGESRRMAQVRMVAFWEEITQQCSAETIALVSHGGSIKMLFRKILGEQIASINFHNTSLSILERHSEKTWQAIELNTTPHLDENEG